jgi:prolyl oligopeptidase
MKKLVFLCLLLSACAHSEKKRMPANAENQDPHLWLEEVEGEKALAWVKERNEESLRVLKSDPKFAELEPEARKILLAKDRIPGVSLHGGLLYNFWQDAEHVRGIWRRTEIDSYKQKDPNWEIILDLDKLAKEENENWVWKGFDCRQPEMDRCLLMLSRGGKDAKVVREFDLNKKEFIKDGFTLPEAKSSVSWIDLNTIFVATDFGSGSMSKSGYPIVVKEWRRGTDLSAAKEVFRGTEEDMLAYGGVTVRPEGKYRVLGRYFSFFESESFYLSEAGKTHYVPMPKDANFSSVFRERFIFQLRSDLFLGKKRFPKGSVVALPVASLVEKGKDSLADLEAVFTPTAKRFLLGVSSAKDSLLLSVLDNVKGRILRVNLENGRWQSKEVALTGNGMASVVSTDDFDQRFIAYYTDYLTPTTYYLGDAARDAKPTELKRSPARFDASGLVSEQREAISRDGTKVPYFLVSKKNLKKDGKNPTLLYGYGGFESPMTPGYYSVSGKLWMEAGGVYVVANIRGGGEFGPAWHQAALREKRQNAFDDFIAVAEDLIKRGITSPRHLGIQGGSNGGLLVGAVYVQRPDLFHAVLCEVPLLDMLRYHLLLAGASWVGEYGNPDVAADREFISKYSPYQNLKANGQYPEVFFLTSTKDDRVHPGHARKMVARMREFGYPVYYYENTEGGHGGAANQEQRILWSSLEFTYLWKKLSLPSK